MRLTKLFLLVTSLMLLAFIVHACTPAPAPTPTPAPTPAPIPDPNISHVRFTEACVRAGTILYINGTNFGNVLGDNRVKINGIASAITYWSDTKIIAAVPANAIAGNHLKIAVVRDRNPSDEYWLYGLCPAPTPVPTPTPTPTPMPDRVDQARQVAIMKANMAGNNVPVNVPWIRQDIPGGGTGVGTNLTRYTYSGAGTWTIELTYPVVPNPNYSAEIYFQNYLVWIGTVYAWEVD